MNKDVFINKVMDMATIYDKETAEKGIKIVFSILSHRMLPDEAKNLEAQLPEGLKKFWNSETWITRYKKLSNQRLNYRHKNQLMSLVENEILRENLNLNPEELTRSVIHVLKEFVSSGELHDIEAQFPNEIKDFFKAA